MLLFLPTSTCYNYSNIDDVNDDNNGLWIVRIEPKPVKKVIP